MTVSTHHTDGGGVSDHVFGLAHLLWFPLRPAYPESRRAQTLRFRFGEQMARARTVHRFYLGRALDSARRRGETVPDTLLTHLVPVGWQHMNLIGHYLWEADSLPVPAEFRRLRQPTTMSSELAVA
jgi:hypothetical protein